MSAPQEHRRWSWIAPDGKESSGEEQTLVTRLKKGELPPATLVWRRTWLEWLPAHRVEELARAFPNRASEPPIEPKCSPAAALPPAKPGAPNLPRPAVANGPAAERAEPQAPSSFGNLGRARGPSVLGPPRAQIDNSAPPRAPLPTLGDEPAQHRSTLRPPGAIPPPPRAVAVPTYELTPSRARDDAEQPARQKPVMANADTVPNPRTHAPMSAQPSELRRAVALPGAPSSVEIRPSSLVAPARPDHPDLDQTLDSTPFEVTAQDFVDLPSPSATLESAPTKGDPAQEGEKSRAAASARGRGSPLSLAMLAGAIGLAVFAVVKFASRPDAAPIRTAPPAQAPPEAPAPTEHAPTGCGIVQPAARLAKAIYRPVAPIVAPVLEGRRAAVGFAESEFDAAGLSVDLVTLDVQRVFQEKGNKAVRFVVPLPTAGRRFAVDREDGRGLVRTLSSSPSLVLATSNADWVRTSGRVSRVVWRGAAAEQTTDPRISSGAEGHVVTFRSGGLSGRIKVGFLAPDGAARGVLHSVEVPDSKFVGTPDAALAGSTWLVAFAARATPDAEWAIKLASGKLGGESVEVRTFPTPPGGAGGSSIAPSVSGLADEGFILQWTEGKSSQYQVRVQRLSERLEPLGEPQLASPKGANAGQGAVFAAAPRALSVFVQTTAGYDELWGTSLECP